MVTVTEMADFLLNERDRTDISRCPKCGDNVMHRALWEQREKAANSAWRAVKCPFRSGGCISIC